MKVTDMDARDTSLAASKTPTDRDWLRLVRAGIVAICALWTIWT